MDDTVKNIDILIKEIDKTNGQIAAIREKINEYQKEVDGTEAYEKDLQKMQIDENEKRKIMGNIIARQLYLLRVVNAAHKYHDALIRLKENHVKLMLLALQIEKIKAGEGDSRQYAATQKIIDIL